MTERADKDKKELYYSLGETCCRQWCSMELQTQGALKTPTGSMSAMEEPTNLHSYPVCGSYTWTLAPVKNKLNETVVRQISFTFLMFALSVLERWMTGDFLQGTAGIHGRSGLPGRKGEQVRLMFVMVKKVAVFPCAYLLFVFVASSRGKLDHLGLQECLGRRD